MNRYIPLLVALFSLLMLQPIAVTLWGAQVSPSILMYLLLAATIYAMSPRKLLITIATLLAAAIIAARLLLVSRPNVSLVLIVHGFSFVLMVLVTVTIVFRVFRASEITAEIILGAVCVYLVIGAAWTYLYFFLQAAAPGSMMAMPIGSSGSVVPAQLEEYRFWEMLYFSLSALSTMGFLSTEPLTPLARQLAVVEAITGQLYVAVLIARIVALSTAGAMKSGPSAN